MDKNKLDEALCKIADMLFKHYDPCKFEKDMCLDGHDERGPFHCCYRTAFYMGQCPYVTQTGCSMPNIKCKTGFCEKALKNMSKDALTCFRALEEIAIIHKLNMRKPHLKDLIKTL